jgi:hypothetical protein
MRKAIILAALSAAISTPANAETLKANYPVCVSQDLLEQFHDALSKQDMPALNWLSANGCAATVGGVHVTVLGLSSWGGYAHVRAYRGKRSAEVWTDRVAVEGYDPLNPSSAR